MARINTNVAALMARTDLGRAQESLNTALQRLSSGLRINRGADDPAGLIASEALRSEMAGLRQAIDNSQRASNIVATAEGALNEVASLLLNIKQLTVQAANKGGFSPEEIKANQAQIDSAVQSITRIANVTNFAGLNLLDGSLDYTLSGVVASQLDGVNVHNAQFGTASSIMVNVNILQSAQTAELHFTASSVASGTSIQVKGNNGVEVFTFKGSAQCSAILDAVNKTREATGVSAAYRNGSNDNSGLVFYSTGWGSKAFVSVEAMPGSTAFSCEDSSGATATRTVGRDVAASINGSYTVGDGLNISLNSTYLSLDLTVSATLGATDTSFRVTGGGAMFQLGPHVSINEQRSLGIQSITASNLGAKALGFLSQIVTGGDYSLVAGEEGQAAKIVDYAIGQVASIRGRLGAFEKNTIETNIRSLEVALENVTSSESTIRDADFAAETAALTRGQILTNAAMSVLSIANSQPASVLQLLQG